MTKWTFAAAVIGLGLALLWGTPEMAKSETYICSPMTGRLVDANGAPASGVTVSRDWFWRGKRGSDSAVSDADGRFSFDAVLPKRGFFGRLPAVEAVNQTYTANGDALILELATREMQLNEETGGKPFNIECNLDAKAGPDGLGWGVCKLIE